MERSEWKYLLWFQSQDSIGSQRLARIKEDFGSFRRAYKARASEWRERGWAPELVGRMLDSRPMTAPEEMLAAVEEPGMEIICKDDEPYPDCLRGIPRSPFALFCQGRLELLARPCVAVVGSRRCSSYGRETARQMAAALSGAGITVVSGLARGIDGAAHEGALQGPGSTIAVLGCGIDRVYPAENRPLFARIAEKGLLVSDYPPGTEPKAEHFPARNRIISGLSRGVLVVEAQARSGALITVDLALEQGRDVMAIPGSIYSGTSAGTHGLIKQGARLVTCLEDILDETGLQAVRPFECEGGEPAGKVVPDRADAGLRHINNDQRRITEWLESGPLSLDELIALSGWEIGRLAQSLLQLEITGLVKSRPGNYYIMSTGQ